MYLSLDWLKELVDIPKKITPQVLGEKLTMHTVEIEEVVEQAKKFNNVVIGEILSVDEHPNADKLQLAEVNIGEEGSKHIVCGAKNIEKGQKVPVALPGAVLPNGMEIKEAEVRGEQSQGMLCAADELGLGEDHSGIMILEKGAKVGQPFASYLKLDDIIFDVDNKSLTNRPDLLSHLGIAREVSVFLDSKLTKDFKNITDYKLPEINEGEELDVKVDDKELCPRYMAVKVDGLEIEESPKWLQDRLTTVGVRPINNIVDITNYVMIETGQPLHAFDSGLVDGIVVRRAKKGEKITTLDEEERELDTENLVIADKEKPIAVAGVMGGSNSEINPDTTSIIIESANFEPVQVRKTSQKLGLRTESSMRFEKSLDPHLSELALVRALELIKKICKKSEMSSQITDVTQKTKEEKLGLDIKPIEVEIDWLNRRIGENLGEEKIKSILENLGFEVELNEDKTVFTVTPPTWRSTKDISIKEDLLEEVARVYGYDNIEKKMPKVEMNSPEINNERKLERQIQNILSTGLSMTEVYNYSFTGEGKLKKMNLDPSSYIRLANPLTEYHTLLKQNLVTNLLDNVKVNQANYKEINIFELGTVYMDFAGNVNKDAGGDENLPYQEKRIGIVQAAENDENLFRKVKGKVESLLDYYEASVKFEPSEIIPAWSDKSIYANIKLGESDLGFVSMVDKKVLKDLGIKKSVAVAEIRFHYIYEKVYLSLDKKHREELRFPPAIRDVAFVVDAKILYNDIKEEIEKFSDLVSKVELFDVYQGDKLGKNKKSLAFHIIYQSGERTLKAEEVEELQSDLTKHLEDKYEAQIRNF